MSAHSYYYDAELSSLQKSTGIYYIIKSVKIFGTFYCMMHYNGTHRF